MILYQTEDGKTRVEVRFEYENVWLTQKLMAELFNTTPQNITLHLKNIYQEGELIEEATCKDFLQVQKEGDREIQRKLRFYSLDAIIAVGYRVNSVCSILEHAGMVERIIRLCFSDEIIFRSNLCKNCTSSIRKSKIDDHRDFSSYL